MNIFNNFDNWIAEFAFQSGLEIFIVLSVIYLLSYKIDALIWFNEYARNDETETSKKITTKIPPALIFITLGLVLFIMLVLNSLELYALNPEYSQTNVFIIHLLTFSVYNILDVLIIDYLMHTRLKPVFMNIPGTTGQYRLSVHIGIFFRNYIYAGVICFAAAVTANFVG
jgi:hypothetical protein